MALIALFILQPRPPVPPPKSLTRNPLNATASSFAPRRRRKWVQASRIWSLGVVRLAGTKVRAPRHRGCSAALINFGNPTAAADAAVGRDLARGARNSGSPPPCTSTCQQTQQGVPVSVDLGGKKQTDTRNLPAVVHGGNEIVRSEEGQMMHSMPKQDGDLLLRAEEVDGESSKVVRPSSLT